MNERQKLLLVDDEADLRELVRELLDTEFQVLLASDGKEALRLARDEKPDLIVLDVLMPGTDGFYICEYLRSIPSTRNIPIIMLTAVQETANRVRAFNSGADDFIPKPFHPDELLARIRAKLRKSRESEKGTSSQLVTCGNLTLDPRTFETRVGGRHVQLTRLEFDLVRFLVDHQGELLTRKQIMEQLWKDESVPDRILDPHLVAVRKKLADFDHTIATIYGSGFILKPNEPESRSAAEARRAARGTARSAAAKKS